jgi:hypothetical protein
MTHPDNRLWCSVDSDGSEYIHVLWGDTVYTGRVAPSGKCIAFKEALPDGALQLVHDYFSEPDLPTTYTFAV